MNNNSKRERFESESPENRKAKSQKMSLEEICNQLTALNAKSAAVEAALMGLTAKVSTLQVLIDAILERLQKNEEKIALVETQQETIAGKINELEQQDKAKCFRLTGFPARPPGKDPFIAVSMVLNAVGMQVEQKDFKKIYMSNHLNKTDAHYTGEFYDERKKDEANRLFKEFRKTKPLLLGNVFTDVNDEKWKAKEIRLRSELTLHTRKLLSEVRTHMDLFRFIWETNGRVLMKKTETSRAIQVRTSSDILRLVNDSTQPMVTS